MTGYEIRHDGHDYQPIPETWLDHPAAFDRRERAGPRLFAVSVAVLPGKTLRVRYAAVNGRVLVAQTAAKRIDANSGAAPAGLVNETGWPRSLQPGRTDPRDCLRTPEWEHFEAIWPPRVDDGLVLERDRPLPAKPRTASGKGVEYAE